MDCLEIRRDLDFLDQINRRRCVSLLLRHTSLQRPKCSATLLLVTGLLEDALRKVAALSREEQDAIVSQILETLEDEAAWKQKLAATRPKLRALADAATREHQEGKTKPLDETL